MTPDDEPATGAGFTGPVSDPLRDLILGFAAQIDQLAALFGGGRRMAATEPGGQGSSGQGSSGQRSTIDASGTGPSITELTGEVTGLLAEIGDLLARLIAALIAVLEAIASALRSAPPAGAQPAATQYQAIAVRIDPSAGSVPADRGRHAAPEREPEGGV